MSADRVVIAALVSKLGGEVYLSGSDLALAEGMELQQTVGDSFQYAVGLRVRSNVTLDGVLAGETLEIEEHSA